MPSKPKPCPLCGEPASSEQTPFCSRGCKDRDLLKWLGEGYSIPGPPTDDDDGGPAGGGPDSDGLDTNESDR